LKNNLRTKALIKQPLRIGPARKRFAQSAKANSIRRQKSAAFSARRAGNGNVES
jgi:hypothetical protein